MTRPAWDPLADLSPDQRETLDAYGAELVAANRRLNLISRVSAGDVARRHLIHSLALAYRSFPDGATVVDFGTGGGLPSIPLAIRFPRVRFVAIDAVGKKVESVRLFARRLHLDNVEVWCGRAEQWDGGADYAVSRATAPLADLWSWYARAAAPAAGGSPGGWAPGLICLKGGDLREEIASLDRRFPRLTIERIPLRPLLGDSYFDEKEIVALCNG